jgi:signal transduction histidine kinase
MAAARISVLIADDEDSVRNALTDLVSSDRQMSVVGSASTAVEAVTLAERLHPDVALVDVKMPGGGPDAARGIKETSPSTRVVALSAYEDRHTVLEMLRAGVSGYVVKGTPAEEILHTIRRSVRGQGSLSVEVTADVIAELVTLLERSEILSRELQELDRTKSELVQILSHELFTPITSIQGFAMSVAENDLSADEIRELAGGVSRASERIRRLVGELGASARLDREGIEIATRPIPAGEIVARVAAAFSEGPSRLSAPSDPQAKGWRVWADAELAVQALTCLVENALEVSGEDQPVEIEIRSRGRSIDVTVLDRGPGVATEIADRIFAPLEQGDASTTRSKRGIGIGLYLARRIMDAHGGEISHAPREGGGSAFTLSFAALDRP